MEGSTYNFTLIHFSPLCFFPFRKEVELETLRKNIFPQEYHMLIRHVVDAKGIVLMGMMMRMEVP